MSARPREGAVSAAPTADLAARLASAAAQAVRKTHTLHRAIPGRVRSADFRVTFDDGRQAVYRVHLEFVREVCR
ncbi:hypothetical protein [Thiocystis violascens]|uniref:Uncharacterized protein n=1 Tax=Thiocystis violascens (strain ATCC 17096 / DSM 198 / 6111) TaxID=765911 RepID=I3Y9A7_THIV6|nr:hypothetical protein [Thiocystis violascens]AFL73575.1 hypothetical protein Thivi_1587 [Thiocystis violascens DSM 198]